MKKNYSIFILTCMLFFGSSSNAQPWTYDFGTGTGTFNTNNSNSTTFLNGIATTPSGGGTYRIRTSNGQGGSFVVANAGTSLGSASELQINSPTGASTGKFGIYDWTSPSTVAYLKTKIRTTSSGNGNLNISFGINTLANDNQGYTSHYNNSLASLTIAYTSGAISSVVRRISGSNTTISSSGFAKDTDQEVEIYANNSSGSLTYYRNGTTYTLATRTWDCWLGGTRIVNNGATAGTLAASTNLSGFGFFAESSASNAAFIYLDDLEYANALPRISISDNGTQVAAANVAESTTNHILNRIRIDAVTGLSPNLTGMTCTTAGGYDAADITNLKVRYSTDATLDGADATLSTLSSPGAAGAKTFPSFTSQTITGGTPGYIFITADIAASSASSGNTISVNALAASDLTFSTGIKESLATAGGTQTIITSNAITTSTISTTSYCAGDTISVPYTISGTYSSNTFTAQISTSSTFASGIFTLGTSVSNIAGTITGTVPSNTTSNNTYYVRVISDSPAVNGSNSATTIAVYNSTTTVAPTTTQTIPFSTNGTTLTVTEGSTPTSRIWKSSTTSGSGYTDITGETATTYVPNFALADTYYVVCETTYPSPCGVVTTTSTEVQIIVTSVAAPVISSSLTASGTYKSAISTYTITASNSPTSYNATGLPAGLSVNTTNGEITGTPTTSGTFNITISATNAGGTGNATLVFTINKIALTVTGATAQSKVYDRANTATITGSTLVGVVSPDVVTINTTGTFASVDVATGISVTSTQTLGGADAGNYTLTQPTGLSANITQKALTITSAAASNKVFDNNTSATITGTLSGIISPDVVTLNGTGTFASSAIANGISVTSTATLSGAQAGNYSLTQPTGLTANITPNNLSDVSFNSGSSASTNTNIDYTLYQGTALTSTFSGVNGSIGVMGFYVRDGGATMSDLDTVGTELTAISFNVTNVANIRSARLFDGTSPLGTAVNVTTSPIVFTGLTGVIAGDDSQLALNLRVTFESSVTDNQQMQFTVSSVTANAAGSSFAAANGGAAVSSTTGDINRIEVTATKISVDTQPVDASVSANMTAFSFRFEDDNNNLDFDTNRTINLTTSGSDISPATPSVTITAPHTGLATFSTVQFTSGPQTGITITGTTTGLTTNTVTSDSFDVISFVNNDFRTITGSGLLWSTIAHWQRFDGTNWVAATALPGSTRRVWIRGTMGTVPSTTVREMTIESGGTLTSSNAMSISDKLIIETGGRFVMNAFLTMDNDSNGSLFEIEDNATFEYANANASPALFQGDENFHPDSNFIINNWDNGTDFVHPTSSPSRAITERTYNNPNTGANYTALFGNLYYRDNSGSDARLVTSTGTPSLNLTHRNLEIQSTLADTDEIRLMGGAQTIGIGGNVIVKDGYFVFGSGSSSAQVVNIEGNLIIEGTNNAAVVIGGVANSSTTNVNLKGNLDASGANRLLSTDLTNCFLNFAGPSTDLEPQTVDFDPYNSGTGPYNQGVSFNISNGAYTKIINQDWTLGDESDITVKTLGTLDFGFSTTDVALNITEAGLTTPINSDFFLETRGTLKITSPVGITSGVANTGNVRTNLDGISARAYSNTGIYHYIGKENQVTGDGLPTSNFGKRVIVEMNLNTYTLTPPSVISITNDDAIGNSYPGGLEIRKGVVLGTTTADFTGTGVLIMSGGLYQINVPTTTSIVPRLTGTYTLTGGTVELNGSLAQTLRGGNAPNTPSYFNLKMSGANTVKINNTPIEVSNTLEISNSLSIFDVEENSMTGNAGITMTGGLLRLSQKNNTLPGLSGIATNYSLTGGTVELYGTSSTQTHSLRGTYGTGSTPPNINYYNVELNSTGANVAALNANVVAQAGFGVAGTVNVNSPTCFKLASGFTITDAGTSSTFEIKPGATFKYGGSITTTGASGNIRTDTRTFPTTASYGFVGATTQTTGTGLPSSMVNLYMDKDASTNFVTLSSSTEVTGALTFYKGKLDVATNTLTIATTGSIDGTGPTDYVVTSSTGTLIRNIGGSGTFDCPIGSASDFNPSSFIWSDAPGITAFSIRYISSTATAGSGLPAAAGCVSASTVLNNGYWVTTSTGTAINTPNITFTRNGHTNAGANLNLHAIVRRDNSSTAWGVAGTWSSPISTVISPATAEVSLSQTALAPTNIAGEFAIATGTNDTSSAAVLSSGASTICSGTSPNLSVAITGSGSLYNLVYTDGTSNFSVTNYTSGTPFTAPVTSSNKTYSLISVTSSGGCTGTGNSGSPTVNVGGTATWIGSWTPSAPSITDDVIFNTGTVYNVPAHISACAMTVKGTAQVTIPTNYNVTLSGALTVENGGSFTLENNANLIQSGSSNPNTGNIKSKRDSSPLYLLDYTLWSSPVENQNLYNFSPNTVSNRFYIYDEPTDQYNSISSGNNFSVGKGYLIRVPRTFSSTTQTVYNSAFTGKPNSGDISYSMSKSLNGFNAVGNPYPSQINVHNFIDANISNIQGTLYFWRKRNNPLATSYATLTKLAYAANAAAGGDTGSTYYNTMTTPAADWVINVGQGFFVQAKSASNLVFTNTMRRGTNNGNQFFRTSNKLVEDPNTFKLNLTSTNGVFSQMVLGYSPEYTLGIDDGIDGFNINSTNYLCSTIEGAAYVIQGRPEFSATDVVPLEYKIENADQYSIAIEQLSGVFASQDVFLKDKLTNTIHDLKSGPYDFSSESGNFKERFEVVYQNPLAVNQNIFNENSVVVYKQNQELVINTGKIPMSNVKVYDIRGRLLIAKDRIDATQVKLFTGTTQEVLLVKITSDSYGTVTKKVVN